MAFPSPPWVINAQAWVSLFYASEPGSDLGVYAAAYVDVEADSTVPHRALVVARRVRDEMGKAYQVVDGWADAPAAVTGLQSLFGYPLREGPLEQELGGLGLVGRAEWSVADTAAAHFADTAGVAVRTPLKLVTRQPRPDGPTAHTTLAGSARSLPCLAVWNVPAEGPLGWLAAKQPIASFRLRDARLQLG